MMFTFITGLAKHKKLGRCKGPAVKSLKDVMSKEEIARIAKQQLLEITVNPVKKTEVDLFSDIKDEDDGFTVAKQEPEKIKKKPGRKRKLPTLESEIKHEIELGDYTMTDDSTKK